MHPIDVLVVGRNCMDVMAVVERFPEENRKVALASRQLEGGGQGGTSACSISRLGGKVVLVGNLGDDLEGEFCLKRLRAFGVNTEHIRIIKGGKTPVAYVFITRKSGRRTIIYEPNTLPKIRVDRQLRQLLAQTRVLLLDPEVTYLAQALASFDRVKIVYDCERWRTGIEQMMATADYFIPSSDFLKDERFNARGSLVEKILALQKMVKGQLIVTNGHDGAYYIYENQIVHVPALPVPVADTTGAGDNFHGAFAFAVSKGMDLHQAVKLSVAVASLSCRQYGGRKGLVEMAQAIAAAQDIAPRFEAV